MRQLIIVRKDLNMSAGKMAAQVAHASWAFAQRNLISKAEWKDTEVELSFKTSFDVWNDWFNDSFTKTVCAAKNKHYLMKAVEMAKEMGLEEDKDFFLFYDHCYTELEPEEDGCTLTCIGFKPLPDEVAHKISKKYQLYR